MSLENQAETLLKKLEPVEMKVKQMQELAQTILRKQVFGNTTFELTVTEKQTAIDIYKTLKSELKSLVDELP